MVRRLRQARPLGQPTQVARASCFYGKSVQSGNERTDRFTRSGGRGLLVVPGRGPVRRLAIGQTRSAASVRTRWTWPICRPFLQPASATASSLRRRQPEEEPCPGWTNARKAFEFAAIGRFKPGRHHPRPQLFYLDKDELPEDDSGSRLGDATSSSPTARIGSRRMARPTLKFFADDAFRPERDGLNVVNPPRVHRADPEVFPTCRSSSSTAPKTMAPHWIHARGRCRGRTS